jgi:hypothetical protein
MTRSSSELGPPARKNHVVISAFPRCPNYGAYSFFPSQANEALNGVEMLVKCYEMVEFVLGSKKRRVGVGVSSQVRGRIEPGRRDLYRAGRKPCLSLGPQRHAESSEVTSGVVASCTNEATSSFRSYPFFQAPMPCLCRRKAGYPCEAGHTEMITPITPILPFLP